MAVLKDISTIDLPRQKFKKFGAAYLTNTELIAILLNTSRERNKSSLDLARELLDTDDSLRNLAEREPEDLAEIKGIGPAKAATIQAAFELAHRYEEERSPLQNALHSPADIAAHFISRFRRAKKEVFTLLCLNNRQQLKGEKQISVGSLSSVATNPREIFSEAFRHQAVGIVLIHNHPSGDPKPSEQDKEITAKLKKGGKLIGISFLDHIILGEDSYFSFHEAELL